MSKKWAVVVAVWLLSLIAHFLLLPFSPSQTSPLLFLDRLFDVGLAIAIVSLGAVIGLWVVRLLAPSFEEPLEHLIFATGIGLGIIAYTTLGLGLLGLFYGWALVLLLGLLALAARAEWTHLVRLLREAWASRERLGPFERGIALVIAALALFSLLQALTPPTDYDGLVYHLTAPKTYLAEHRLVSFPHIPQANFPATGEMLYTIAMGLGSAMAAKLVHLSFALLTSMAIFSMARRFLNPKVAWLSLAVLWSIPIFVVEAGSAYIDLVWTFYEFLALYALLLWRQNPNRKWLLCGGFFMGFGLGAKYLALQGFILLFGTIAFSSWQSNQGRLDRTAKDLLLWVGIVVTLASPWYLKNWIGLGNPIYPYLFGGLNYPVQRVQADAYMAANLGCGHSLQCYLSLPWMIYTRSYLFGHAPPASPSFLSLFLPFWLLWRKNRMVNWLLALSLARFGFWAITSQDLRFLLPAYPALGVVTGYILYQIVNLSLRRLPWDFFVGALVMSILLINLGLQLYKEATTSGNPLPVILGRESQVAYLRRSLVDYPVTKFINTTLPSDAKILFVGDGRNYYFQRQHIPDATNNNWWGYLVPLGGSQEAILALLRRWGISHIVFSEADVEWLLAWDADGRIEQGMQLFFAFEERYLTEIYADRAGFHVYEVPP